MRVLIAVWALVTVLCTACTPEAVRYAELRYPGCAVEDLGEERGERLVRVWCPGAEPVVKQYRER